MSNTPLLELPAQGVSSEGAETLASRTLQVPSDPSVSKRVSFYKSGDHKFGGHRMVITSRTFKTFDTLLDALSNKVPLPFGVRTITTPRGTHSVKALEDLRDGGSYVCSDQRRVKPLNLDAVHRPQVPWNTTRPVSTGRRRRRGPPSAQLPRRSEGGGQRAARITGRVTVRTPKRLVVIKNRDPTVKRTVVVQRRMALTFDALLDYLSQVMQFPVLKLYHTDGRRVDGLAALILCSGVIVAAGNETFRLGNYDFHATAPASQSVLLDAAEPSRLQPLPYNHKSFSSGRGSRNFSLSSERYIANQINGSINSYLHQKNGSIETEPSPNHRSIDMETVEDAVHGCILPQDDDIEKSFRVNQDGSMTVEMKVRLTIKEEEMLHWTTTLSRASLNQRRLCASNSETGNDSPDSNNATAKDASGMTEHETKEDNHSAATGKGIGFNGESVHEGDSPADKKTKSHLKRNPTPGPRRVKKKTSIESVTAVTESGVQESTTGRYSYTETTADGETSGGFCVVRHSKSSSTRPIPKPRKTASAGARNKGPHASIRSSGVAEVLQIENNGMEITETVMHIYEGQGGYDNYLANSDYNQEGEDSASPPQSKPGSIHTGSHLCSNDCDVDFTQPSSSVGSRHREKEEMLSLSSDTNSPACEMSGNQISLNHNEAWASRNSINQSPVKARESFKKDKAGQGVTKKKVKPKPKKKTLPSTSTSEKQQKDSVGGSSKTTKSSSDEKPNSHASGKNNGSSPESSKNVQKGKEKELPRARKNVSRENKTSSKTQAGSPHNEQVNGASSKRTTKTNHKAPRDNGHNVNAPESETARPPMKKNMSNILRPKQLSVPGKAVTNKQKSMSEKRLVPPKQILELSESVSMPVLNPASSDVHQYVENWLQKISPDSVPYMEAAATEEAEPLPKVVFQIGGGSDSEGTSECQANAEGLCPPPDGASTSVSCLSVPVPHERPTREMLNSGGHIVKGLCVSMPSIRMDSMDQRNRLGMHKSAEEIGPWTENEKAASTSSLFSPNAKMKPVLRQLCSSIQYIRRASEAEKSSNLEKSKSLDFSTQVASVFGSSSKALLSFLSVMTLRETLTGAVAEDNYASGSPSEAMLVMESLQKISTIGDKEEQRASLTDLQSRTSSQLTERWRDFLVLRERLESEPLSPKFSDTEFALDVASDGGDPFDDRNIDEIMEEFNMPKDFREEISSTFQHMRSFYPEVEESTFVDNEKHLPDSEEELEQFIDEGSNDMEQSTETAMLGVGDTVAKIPAKEDVENDYMPGGEFDDFNQTPSLYQEQTDLVCDSEQELEHSQEIDPDVKESEAGGTETDEQAESSKGLENDSERGLGGDACDSEEEEDGASDERKLEGEGTGDDEDQADEFEDPKEGEDGSTGETVGSHEGTEKVEKERIEADRGLGAAGSEEEMEETEAAEKEEIGEKEEAEDGFEARGEEKLEWQKGFIGGEGDGEENKQGVNEEEMGAWRKEKSAEGTDEDEEGREGIDEVKDDDEEEEESPGQSIADEEEKEFNEDRDELRERGGVTIIAGDSEEEEVTCEPGDEGDEEGRGETESEEPTNGDEREGEGVVEDEEGAGEEDIPEGEDKEKGRGEEIDEGKDREESAADTGAEQDGTIEEDEGEEHRQGEDNEVEKAGNEEEREEADTGKDTTVSDAENEVEGEESGEEKEEEEEEEESGAQTEDQQEDGGEQDEEAAMDAGQEEEEEGEQWSEEGGEDEVEGQAGDSSDGGELAEEGGSQGEEDDEESRSGKPVVAQADATDNYSGGRMLDEACYLQRQSSCEDRLLREEPETETQDSKYDAESLNRYLSEGLCENDGGGGTDTANEFKTDDGEDEECEGTNGAPPHPVEISQQLIDFINSALQSSSLIFTYDVRGNIRIEPDNAQVVQKEQLVIPQSREDTLYGLKRLPSPNTSDLSDYRPETSESGGYKTQVSVDLVSENGEEPLGSEPPGGTRARRTTKTPSRRGIAQAADPKASPGTKPAVLPRGGSFSSVDSGTKVDPSSSSASRPLKTDPEKNNAEVERCTSFPSEGDSNDGVLIDKGRWLLKENHLIRKSPPVVAGMYENLDSASVDTVQDNPSEGSPPRSASQHNALTVISSSELEEMAKPQTPHCTYYNMPHGSDSDPFLDDVSVKSWTKGSSGGKGRALKVSPTIDTSKTWAKKNGSLSSFASVEFKLPDSRVHPEGDPSAARQARRSSSAAALQAQDSLDTVHVRCSQYCPIL